MSAYNIYKKPTTIANLTKNTSNINNQKSNFLLDKLFSEQQRLSLDNTQENLVDKKTHLSSTGSSINVSPTSQSSLESSNNIHKKQLNEPQQIHQVKPPETPRTKSAASNYRKNLLLSNLNQKQTIEESQIGLNTKTDDLREFLEKKNQQPNQPSTSGSNEVTLSLKQELINKPVVSIVNKLDLLF